MSLTFIHVAIGGALGAVMRYGVGLAALRLFGAGFPWGTLCVNVVGSFVMGVAAVMLGGGRLSPFIMTGVLGGFTTFSAFSLDAVSLYERGDLVAAGGYVTASVVLAIAALFAGMAFAKVISG